MVEPFAQGQMHTAKCGGTLLIIRPSGFSFLSSALFHVGLALIKLKVDKRLNHCLSPGEMGVTAESYI